MNLTMNYIDRTELLNDAPQGIYDPLDEPALDRLITRASRLMRKYTKLAIYDTDELDMPTDPRVLAAFKDATSSQVLAWVQADVVDALTNEGATAQATVASSSNNGASITLDNSEASAARAYLIGGGLSSEAKLILEDAGLIGIMPWLRV